MNPKPNTFERLVVTLESEQRQNMLRQLANITELQEEDSETYLKGDSPESAENFAPNTQFLEEPLFIRLWFTIIAFFTSNSPTRLHSEYLVSKLGKKLDVMYGPYIDIRQGCYTDDFYQELLKLKQSQGFLSALLSSYETDKSGFIIILGSLMLKKTSDAIQKTTDPFSVPIDQELKKDVRLSFIRELDAIFLSISESERYQMFQAMQALEWLRNFCAIPFERMLFRFNSVQGIKQICLLNSVEEEIKFLVNLLCSAKKIPVLLLEALFIFNEKDAIDEEKFDFESECSAFVAKAAAHLSGIRQFKMAFSLTDFVRYTVRDVTWKPELIDGAEDWFILFKNAWKKRFDNKWTSWNRLHRKAMLEKSICLFLDKEELPALVYHPWEGLWLPLFLHRELSLCFLKGMFNFIYGPELMKPMKILLINGDFYRRENLIEYTDAFSTLDHLQQQIEIFENRLSSKGDIGEGFFLISKDGVATIKGKARLENLMLTTESDAEHIISRAKAAFRSIDAILGGVLGVVRGGPYETLVNMAAIQGKQNENYRKELDNVRQIIRNATEILSDAEVIEKEAT